MVKKMRNRDPELDARWGTICTLTQLVASKRIKCSHVYVLREKPYLCRVMFPMLNLS